MHASWDGYVHEGSSSSNSRGSALDRFPQIVEDELKLREKDPDRAVNMIAVQALRDFFLGGSVGVGARFFLNTVEDLGATHDFMEGFSEPEKQAYCLREEILGRKKRVRLVRYTCGEFIHLQTAKGLGCNKNWTFNHVNDWWIRSGFETQKELQDSWINQESSTATSSLGEAECHITPKQLMALGHNLRLMLEAAIMVDADIARCFCDMSLVHGQTLLRLRDAVLKLAVQADNDATRPRWAANALQDCVVVLTGLFGDSCHALTCDTSGHEW